MPVVKRMWVFKLGAGLKGLRNHLGSKEEKPGTAAGKDPTTKEFAKWEQTILFCLVFKLHVTNKMVYTPANQSKGAKR